MQFKRINDSQDLFSVKPVSERPNVQGYRTVGDIKKEGQRDQSPPRSKKKVKDYFKPLAKAAETANLQLEQRRSPYRFCVYKKKDRVLIEMIMHDAAGKQKTILSKDITNEDFRQWIDDIANIEGLIIDKRG